MVFRISSVRPRQFARFSHYFSHFRASEFGDWFESRCVASQPPFRLSRVRNFPLQLCCGRRFDVHFTHYRFVMTGTHRADLGFLIEAAFLRRRRGAMLVENLLPFMIVAAILFGVLWVLAGLWDARSEQTTGRDQATGRDRKIRRGS
jgi:hypothetical protein